MKRTRTFKHGTEFCKSRPLTNGNSEFCPVPAVPCEEYRAQHEKCNKTASLINHIRGSTAHFLESKKLTLGRRDRNFPKLAVKDRDSLPLVWEGCTSIVCKDKKEIYFRRRAS